MKNLIKQVKVKYLTPSVWINKMVKGMKLELTIPRGHEPLIYEDKKEYDPTSVDSLFL